MMKEVIPSSQRNAVVYVAHCFMKEVMQLLLDVFPNYYQHRTEGYKDSRVHNYTNIQPHQKDNQTALYETMR